MRFAPFILQQMRSPPLNNCRVSTYFLSLLTYFTPWQHSEESVQAVKFCCTLGRRGRQCDTHLLHLLDDRYKRVRRINNCMNSLCPCQRSSSSSAGLLSMTHTQQVAQQVERRLWSTIAAYRRQPIASESAIGNAARSSAPFVRCSCMWCAVFVVLMSVLVGTNKTTVQ